MKKIYEFTLPKEEEVEKTDVSVNDKGEEVTTTRKVKEILHKKFFIQKPTRRLYDEAELFYAVKLSEGIRAGLLTRALLAKRFANDGGVLSDDEKDSWNDLYNNIFEKQVELQALALKTKEERSSAENKQYDAGNEWLHDARKRIQEFEMTQQSLYDQTAENRARNKTILWWVLHLAHSEDDGIFFGKGTYDEKIDIYDQYEESEEEFISGVISKFFYYVSFWYVSKTNSQEEFQELLDFAEQSDTGDLEEETKVMFQTEDEFVLPEEESEPVEKSPSKKPKKKRAKKKKKEPVVKNPKEEKPQEEEKSQEEEPSTA